MLLAILALITNPQDGVVVDRCDLLHTNHVYTSDGDHCFSQLIGEDFCFEDCAFHVVFWRLAPDNKAKAMRPAKFSHGYYVLWLDGETMRRVESNIRLETWSQRDLEIDDRRKWPQDKRRGLSKP